MEIWDQIAVLQMICGGVLERFPRSGVAFMESGLPDVKMTPSDDFKRQCWIAPEVDEVDLAGVLQCVGDVRVVWASDDPHFDCKSCRGLSMGANRVGSRRRSLKKSSEKMPQRCTVSRQTAAERR